MVSPQAIIDVNRDVSGALLINNKKAFLISLDLKSCNNYLGQEQGKRPLQVVGLTFWISFVTSPIESGLCRNIKKDTREFTVRSSLYVYRLTLGLWVINTLHWSLGRYAGLFDRFKQETYSESITKTY